MAKLGRQATPAGVVVNIQHFSTHDGPGIRGTVFLKGCSLRCAWCCNPETIRPKIELALNPKRCIGHAACGRCAEVCPRSALGFDGPAATVQVDWDACDSCGACAAACPALALHVHGRVMTVDEVLDEVEVDRPFYAESGGGLTLSGGECLLQPEFCAALLSEARRRGLNTAIETAGNAPWRFLRMVLPHVDVVLHDFKLSDPARHREWTGAGNARILANFQRAYAAFPHIRFIARIPLIAGVNDDEAHIQTVLDFVRGYPNVVDLELLPYHGYGGAKRLMLGRSGEPDAFETPSPESLARLRGLVDGSFGREGRDF